MSNRNRFADTALGVVVGVGIALLFLVWAFPGFRNPTYQQERYHNTKNRETGEDNPVIRPSLWETYTTPMDTYAQWIAAFAALGSVGVSIWAVRLVRDTLLLNRDATRAAQDSVKVASEIGHAQIRAYLSGVNGSFGMDEDWFHCWVNVKNYGQSPAFRIFLQATITGFAAFVGGSQPVRRNSAPSENICGPIMAGGEGSIFVTWNHTDFEGDAHAVIATGAGMLWVDCVLTYQDVFRETQTAHFTMSLDNGPVDPSFENGFLRTGSLSANNRDKD